MKLYHGSYTAIEYIDFSFCQKRRDFGKGFYVTKFLEQAEYWAERKGNRKKLPPVVTEYDFDEYWLEDDTLKILRFEDYCEEWLAFIVANRNNRKNVNMHDYDIVEGPVADDDIAVRVFDYIKGRVSAQQFLKELTYKKEPTHQICFCTMRSLQALEQDNYDIDSKTMKIDKNIIQALLIDYKMDEIEATDKYYTSDIYAQLSDKTTKLYLKNWQEIYEILKKEISK